MPQGPPWIAKAGSASEMADGPLNQFRRDGYRLELDENRLWTVAFAFGPASDGVQNEQELLIAKPKGNFWERHLTCRHPSGEPHTVTGFKFDNEDLFVWAQHKNTPPDAGQSWHKSAPTKIELDPGSTRDWVLLYFTTPRGNASTVRISRE